MVALPQGRDTAILGSARDARARCAHAGVCLAARAVAESRAIPPDAGLGVSFGRSGGRTGWRAAANDQDRALLWLA